MADGIVFTGDTGVAIDNSIVGTTIYRQRIVIGADNSSSGLVNPTTVWPSSATMALPVRVVGSSGVVLGSVAQSSNWNISTGAVVGLTTTATVGLTTTSFVGLSSSIQNYVTNSTTVPVYLGQSSANVVGIISQSSNWNISTGAVVGLTTTATVALTTANTIGFTSATLDLISGTTGNKYLPVRLTDGSTFYTAGAGGAGSTLVSLSSGTAQIGALGPSSGNVIGLVAPSTQWTVTTSVVNATSGVVSLTTTANYVTLLASTTLVVGIVGLSSAVTLSSGTLTLGTLTTGTVVGLTTTSIVINASGTQTIGTVIMSSGLGASTAIIGSLSSGTAQIGILGPSSANVIGTVAQSSNWNISTGAIVSLSSALSNYVTNSTTVPVYLGASTSNIVGLVSQSSAFALSSGSAYVGTVVSASSGLVYFSTTTAVGINGFVANSTFPATITSGQQQGLMTDQFGRQVVTHDSPPNLLNTATVLTAGTCGSTFITAPGAGLRTAIVMLTAYTTSITGGIVVLQTSSGQAAPGGWSFTVPDSCARQLVTTLDFAPPLYQQTANNGWFVVSTSSATNVRVHAQYFTLSTA